MKTQSLYDVVGIGTPSLDILYAKGRGLEKFGGATTNTIVLLQRFGLKTALIGRVGKDYVGEKIIKELNEDGVDTSKIRMKGKTAKCYIFTTPEERKIIQEENYDSLESLLKQDMDYIASSKCVLISIANPLSETVLSTASGYPIKLFTNLQRFEPTNRLLKTLQNTNLDTVVGNEEEVGKIKGILENILRKGAKVLMTQGKKGCTLYTSSGIKEYKGYRVDSIDPTGAGDAFIAGFIYGMLNRWDLDKSCDFANRLGALATTYYGARSKKLTLEDALSLK